VHSEELFESYSGFSVYFRILSQENAEFWAQLGHEKLHLKLKPALQATRRVLKGEGIRSDELLVCPHIAEPLAQDLRRAGVAHADLNGRLFLRTTRSIIDLRPVEARYRSPKKGPDLFSPKATRIIRSLLCLRDLTTTQEELANSGFACHEQT
ncbi:MAG: hypothetical protein RLZZ245_524, partial [Verrucomicrobiota bacterium]